MATAQRQKSARGAAVVRFLCPHGHALKAPLRVGGKYGFCPYPGCEAVVCVPTPSDVLLIARPLGLGRLTYWFRCPRCRHRLKVASKYLGYEVACNFCDYPFALPELV